MTSKARNIADLGSNDVIETTATGVDVTGTITADGLTVDGASQLNTTGLANGLTITGNDNNNVKVRFDNIGTGGSDFVIQGGIQGVSNQGLSIRDLDNSAQRLYISSGGDVSFYEDTGTTAKMVWSSSAESLGIGTASPSAKLDSHSNSVGVRATRASNTDQYIELVGGDGAGLSHINANYQMAFKVGDSERARLDSSGNLLVNTTSDWGVAGNAVFGGGVATRGSRAVTETVCQGASGTFSKVEITFAGNNDNSTGIMDVQLASFNERAADYCVMQYSTGSTNQMRSNVTGFSVAITGTPNSTGSVWKMTITGTMTHPVVTAKCTVGGLATGFSSAPNIVYS